MSENYTYAEALIELRRQLQAGEATREQYEEVIQKAENLMIDMHRTAQYDVLYYMQLEQTANVYREALGLPKSDISERAKVSPTLTNAEYAVAMAAEFGEPTEPEGGERCHYCGMPATSTGPFGEPICPGCGG